MAGLQIAPQHVSAPGRLDGRDKPNERSAYTKMGFDLREETLLATRLRHGVFIFGDSFVMLLQLCHTSLLLSASPISDP